MCVCVRVCARVCVCVMHEMDSFKQQSCTLYTFATRDGQTEVISVRCVTCIARANSHQCDSVLITHMYVCTLFCRLMNQISFLSEECLNPVLVT